MEIKWLQKVECLQKIEWSNRIKYLQKILIKWLKKVKWLNKIGIKYLQKVEPINKAEWLQKKIWQKETRKLERIRNLKGIENFKRIRKGNVQRIVIIIACIFILTGCSTQKNDSSLLLTEPYTATQENEEQRKKEGQEQPKEKNGEQQKEKRQEQPKEENHEQSKEENQEQQKEERKEQQKKESQEDKNSKILSDGINPFAFDLLEELIKKDETVFFSPYSISMVLLMAANGADSKTKEEFFTTLKITNLEEWNKQTEYFLNREAKQGAMLSIANSIWIQNGLKLSNQAGDLFLKPVSKYYKAEAIQADFTNENAVELVNNWVSEKTDGMIKKLLNQINKDASMILLNAVYFDGVWKTKFKQEGTYEETFYGTEENQTVNIMHLSGKNFKYYENYGIKAVQLPYKDGSVVMNVILPQEETKTIMQVMQELTQKEKLDFLKELNQTEETTISTLALPKFELEYGTIQLKEILKKLGIGQAFETYADFDMIHEDIYLKEVYHKAKIEVDEEGSRAAAATAAVQSYGLSFIKEGKEFIADRPFLFIIQDTESEIILFMGVLSKIPA